MKLERKPMRGKLKKAVCLVGASLVVLGSGSMLLSNYNSNNNSNEKSNQPTTQVEVNIDKESTPIFVDDDRYETKREIRLPLYDESSIDNTGLEDVEVVKDDETITSDYRDEDLFRTNDILIVTMIDSYDNKSYFIMNKLYNTDVTVGNGMVEKYMYKYPEYTNYKVYKWHNEYESVFNGSYFLLEHGYTLKGTNDSGAIYDEFSSKELAFTSDNRHILFTNKRVVTLNNGNCVLVNTDNPDYAWFRFNDNKYNVRLYTISLSDLISNRVIRYSELKDLYNKINTNGLDLEEKTLMFS